MRGCVPRVTTWVAKRPGVWRGPGFWNVSTEDDGHVVGAPEVEVVTDGGLEPGPPGLGLVEHGSVGELEVGGPRTTSYSRHGCRRR